MSGGMDADRNDPLEELRRENKKLKNRILDLEAEQLGQQVATERVKYALSEVERAEKNDLLTRKLLQQYMRLVQMACTELEEHDCRHACDGVAEAALAILKTEIR
jgi:hypothetical protein